MAFPSKPADSSHTMSDPPHIALLTVDDGEGTPTTTWRTHNDGEVPTTTGRVPQRRRGALTTTTWRTHNDGEVPTTTSRGVQYDDDEGRGHANDNEDRCTDDAISGGGYSNSPVEKMLGLDGGLTGD
jgi:hypothetical protein